MVRVGALPRLPEPIERTIYFCCLEALQNVAKHAGPDATATVRMHLDGRWVEFAVEDDGVGFPPGEVLPGAGLDNLADRVASHGGTLRVESEPAPGRRSRGGSRSWRARGARPSAARAAATEESTAGDPARR